MLESLMDYRPCINPDGKMDYKLVIVHVPLVKDFSHLGEKFRKSWDPFQKHVRNMAVVACEKFSKPTLELERAFSEGLTWGIGNVARSYGGEIEESTKERYGIGTTTKQVVLVGTSFGNCHERAFRSLIYSGINEIHMPLDGTNGFLRDWYPEEKDMYEIDPCEEAYFSFRANPYLDVSRDGSFPEYVETVVKRKNYQVFIPCRDIPFQQGSDGMSPELLVVFHKSWKSMMKLFNVQKLSNP